MQKKLANDFSKRKKAKETRMKKAKYSKRKFVSTDGVEDSQCPICGAFWSQSWPGKTGSNVPYARNGYTKSRAVVLNQQAQLVTSVYKPY